MKSSKRCSPPGMEMEKEQNYYYLLLLLLVFPVLEFAGQLGKALNQLNRLYGYEMMPDFYEFMKGKFLLFGIIILYCLGTMVFRFFYYYQGSKSIYLMRRLPDRSLLIRSCVETPLQRISISLLVMMGMVLLLYLAYWIATPMQYLQPDQWQKFWRWLL